MASSRVVIVARAATERELHTYLSLFWVVQDLEKVIRTVAVAAPQNEGCGVPAMGLKRQLSHVGQELEQRLPVY